MQTFPSFDGTILAYHTWGEPGGDLPPVVLHHGFSTSAAANWKAPGIVDALVGAGRHVIAVDARGHGSSDKPHDPARYGEDKMARDLTALFDLLGLAQVDLVGYSMGGVVALLTAAADPRIRRLVTGGIGAGAVEQGGVDRAALPGRALIDGLLTDDLSTITDERVMGFRLFADASGADRQALAAQAQAGHRTPIALDRITIPALVLAGTDDWLATRPEVLAAALPDARWKVIPGDHLTVVRNPEFATTIVSFLV